MSKKWVSGSVVAVLLAVLGQSGLAQAAGDAAAGATKIAVCAACHLAGQWAPYLESALKAYRAGERTGGMTAMMAPQAANLSDEDIADIAAYYSAQ